MIEEKKGCNVTLHNGWYGHNLVKYLIQEKLISRSAIKYQLLAETSLACDTFRDYVENLYSNYETSNTK